MTQVIPRAKAKHPFNVSTDSNRRGMCLQCPHREDHEIHESSNWCYRPTCQHAFEEHNEEGCLVDGCSCKEMLLDDFTGRVQELEKLEDKDITEGRSRVDGERQQEHGNPVDNLKKIAIIWSALIGIQITAHDVAVMMGAFKNVRQMANPEHEDNLTDVEGYAEIARRCVEAGEYVPMGVQRGSGWK